MGDVYIIGAGMTALGRHLARSVKSLTAEAVERALTDAKIVKDAVQSAWFCNTRQGALEGQHGIRGQCSLRAMGFERIPIINTDNACASSSTGVIQAYAAIAAGMYEVALVVGAEKMNFPERRKEMFEAFKGSWDRDLAEDAVWLAEVVATSLPGEPEAWGLAALLRFQHARSAARFDASGDLVLLKDQDRTRWDAEAIALGEAHLERAAALERPGRLQLQAAIAACHASSPTWAQTDWLQIATLYDVLVSLDPSPVARLNRAVARAQLGPSYAEAALADLDTLAAALDGYHLFHATRAELLTGLGRVDAAEAANIRALELTTNDAERRLLLTRLHRHPLTDGS